MRRSPTFLSLASLCAALAVVAGTSSALAQEAAHDHAHDHAPAPAAPIPPVGETDRVLGRSDAPVTIVEYSSFTCPHCADWHANVLPRLRAELIDTGQVRLVVRDFPTSPAPVAIAAAKLARCAAPDAAPAVSAALFQGQAALYENQDVNAWLTNAAQQGGRSIEELAACVNDEAAQASLAADVQAAAAAGVQGTPSFFVDGQRVADGSFESLAAAVRARLETPSAATPPPGAAP